MTSTGFIMTNGQDISTIFEPYSGGTKSALSNYVISNGKDLNEVFDPYAGTDASATGFYTIDGLGVERDLNKVFAKAKVWSSYVVGGGDPLSTYISVVYDFSIDTATNGIYVGGSHTSTDYFNKRVAYTTPNNGWKQMGSGLSITNSGASAQVATTVIYNIYAVSSSKIIACGYFTKSGNISLSSGQNGLANFVANRWYDMGGPNASYTSYHYKSDTEMYMATSQGAFVFNSISKTSANLGNIFPIIGGFVTIFAVNSANIYLGGQDNPSTNKLRFYRFTFNGTSGSFTALTNNTLDGRINTIWAIDNSNIYLGGTFTNSFGVSANYIVKYNGVSTFTALTTLNAPNGEVINIHFLTNAKIYVTYKSGSTFYLSQYISNTWTILLSATNKFIVKQINTQLYVCGVNTSYTNVKTNTTITTNSGVLFIDL